MDTTPRKRVLKSVLLHSLQRYREFDLFPADEFEIRNADYPQYLREMACAYEQSPAELYVPEAPGFEGYAMWAQNYDQETENPVILGENEALGDVSRRYPAATVLDMGAGTGRHAIPYARTGAQVVAIEPNEQMLEIAQKKAQTQGLKIDFRQAELFSSLDMGYQFDVVLCCLVLGHVPDISAAIDYLAQRVGERGYLILTDFHPTNLLVGMRTSFVVGEQKYYVPNYIHLPSEYFSSASKWNMGLVEFHESGSISGYPGMPATLSIVFRKEMAN